MCDRAEFELHKIESASFSLPGRFNRAASTAVGGSKSDTYVSNQDWAIQAREQGVDITDTGVREEEARITFLSGIVIMGTNEQQKRVLDDVDGRTIKVLKEESVGLEVTSIIHSTPQTRELFGRQNAAYAPKIQLEPLGKLLCRSWQIPDHVEYDLPKDKYPSGRPTQSDGGKVYEFWVEDSVLDECFLGMRMRASVLVLEGEIMVFDQVSEVLCSFYTWLPNEIEVNRQGTKEVVIRERGVPAGYEVEKKPESDESDLAVE